jgi:signal transduction histidine kinase
VVEIGASFPVWADRQRLIEVVENLVGNAVKYSPAGGRILVSAMSEGDEVRLAVADQGLGIPDSALASLFERFKRIDTPDRAQIRGTGLGLYLVQRYVESFGGRIEVQSELGAGSTFTVTLRSATASARHAA